MVSGVRFCPACGSEGLGARFCEQCGSELPVAASGGDGPAATAPPAEPSSQTIESGQWIVGTEVPTGLYRFSGSFASRDASDTIRTISVCYSGLGLAKVLPTDATVQINGQAIRADYYGSYDVLANSPSGGCYLVGIDIPPGRYRLSAPGGLASWSFFDRSMNLLSINNNPEQILVTIDESVFAVAINGTPTPV